ncbi:stage V sporulation protein B [Cohnella sp. GCM10012308]|uniref:stage V sporulation protein B n=1 Tax=Cohnella sp. GCM10012308 TaxID=3317329 RepID=UPI00360F1E91
MSPRKQTFIQGAMILLAAGLLNRLLGFVPRIALPRLIGAEGVGLVQLVFPFFIVVLTIITGGLPLAVAKLVAAADSRGDAEEAVRIRRTALSIAMTASLIVCGLCFALSDWISSSLMTDPRVHTAFLAIIPVIPLVAVSSIWRGYFQGKQDMLPTAVSQTVETVIRIVLSLTLAFMFLPWGLEAAAAGAMIGTGAGELAGLAALWMHLRGETRGRGVNKGATSNSAAPATLEKLPAPTSAKETRARALLRIAVPVTGSRMIGSLSYLFESILTARALIAAGLATAAATAQYGILQGMVIPLLLLPGSLTFSLATSLVPSLSEAAARGDRPAIQKRLHQSMRLAVVTGAPFIILMALFGRPICGLIYGDPEPGALLSLLAPAAVFLYMQAPLQAALQALDRPGTALFNTFAGALVKLILIVQLASKPELGIRGAVIAIGANMALVTLLHWISVVRLTGVRLLPGDFLKIGAAMTIMGAIALWIWNMGKLPGVWLDLLAAGIVSLVAYLLLLMAMRLIDRHDAARIPILGRFFK